MTLHIDRYTTGGGREPVREWLNALSDVTLKATMRSKIDSLCRNGFDLLNTKAMKRLAGYDNDFYELRGGQGRITLYFDRGRDTFVLLNAFLKKRDREKDKIEEAHRFLHDYLERRGRSRE